jgi:hypothetical protein
MIPPHDAALRQHIQQVLLTVFGCHTTRDEYSTEHLLAVVRRLLGPAECSAEVLVAELHRCPFARVRTRGSHLRWRFVNASSVRPRQRASGYPGTAPPDMEKAGGGPAFSW